MRINQEYEKPALASRLCDSDDPIIPTKSSELFFYTF